MDTECYAPVELSLCGSITLALQSEGNGLVNNAQMAGVAGHPLWERLARRAVHAAQQGQRDPLHAAGPYALTNLLRVRVRAGPCCCPV
jgi:hypothetical protein